MAKQRGKIEGQSIEPVANCDQLPMAVEQQLAGQEDIAQLIMNIRGMQVMVDRDLAILYGVENKRLNEQVRRNIERFPERFRFQLTKEETNELVANCDRLNTLKHSTVIPYVFTEQGISMLSTVLHSQTAIAISIKIMDAFVAMRRFITTNAQYSLIEIKQFNKAHDRFLLIDDEVYHIGASIKDLGKKWFGFTLMHDITATELINKIKE